MTSTINTLQFSSFSETDAQKSEFVSTVVDDYGFEINVPTCVRHVVDDYGNLVEVVGA